MLRSTGFRTMAGRLRRFDVTISDRALSDVEDIRMYIALGSPSNADRVAAGLFQAMRGLSVLPRRNPSALEVSSSGGELRQVTVFSYRVVYEVLGERVHVHTVRHAARQPASDI
jgi:toxin ParE1/3/4